MLAPEDDSRALDALRISLASDIVELVVLSTDEAFLQTLREAAGPARRIWHVLSADKVSDLLVAGGVGILVLDVQAWPDEPSRFIVEIKRQFPDLVIVAAGHREAQSELAHLISDGSVYRYIHKPVSPARARLFAEAAVRRYEERGRRAARTEPPAPARSRKPASRWIGVGAAACCVLLVATWLANRGAREKIAAPGPGEVSTAPDAADLREQRLAREQAKADATLARLRAKVARPPARVVVPPTGVARSVIPATTSTQAAISSPPPITTLPDVPASSTAAPATLLTAPVTAASSALAAPAASLGPPVPAASLGPPVPAATSVPAAPAASPVPAAHGASTQPASSITAATASLASATSASDIAAGVASGAGAEVAPGETIGGTTSTDESAKGAAPATLVLVKSVSPAYPAAAQRAGIEGWVELDFTVSDTGSVGELSVHAAKPAGVFDAAALAALSRWRYQPPMRDGRPVSRRSRIRIRFALPR